MPYKDTETGTAKEKRAARDKARNQARKQLEQPQRKSRRQKPGKTQFASYIKVKDVRQAGKRHKYYLHLTVGPFFNKRVWYSADTGSLQLSTCPMENWRFEVNDPFYVNTLRPMIVAAIQDAISKKQGRPVKLLKSMRFEPEPRIRKRKSTVAA
jgi:hypothetical protein